MNFGRYVIGAQAVTCRWISLLGSPSPASAKFTPALKSLHNVRLPDTLVNVVSVYSYIFIMKKNLNRSLVSTLHNHSAAK